MTKKWREKKKKDADLHLFLHLYQRPEKEQLFSNYSKSTCLTKSTEREDKLDISKCQMQMTGQCEKLSVTEKCLKFGEQKADVISPAVEHCVILI